MAAFQQQFPFGMNSGAGIAQAQQQTRGTFSLLRTAHSRQLTSPRNSVGAARHRSGARAYGQQNSYGRPSYSPGPYPGRRARSSSDGARNFNTAREGTATPRASSRLNQEEQQDQWDSLLSRITALEAANRNLAQLVAAMGVEPATNLDGRYDESERKFKMIGIRLLQSNSWHW